MAITSGIVIPYFYTTVSTVRVGRGGSRLGRDRCGGFRPRRAPNGRRSSRRHWGLRLMSIDEIPRPNPRGDALCATPQYRTTVYATNMLLP